MKLWPFKKKEPSKTEKRQRLDPRDWVPLSASAQGAIVPKKAGALSQVRRGLNIYCDLLVNSPLCAYDKTGQKVEGDEIVSLMEKPARWLSKSEFYSKLVTDLFVSGDFFCHIFESRGKITALAPYPASAIEVYPKGKSIDSSNPTNIQERGFFYQSAFKDSQGQTKRDTLPEDKVWHLKSLWGSSARTDSLNGIGLWEGYGSVIDFCSDILETSQKFSQRGGIPPSCIKGTDEMDDKQKKALRDALHDFFTAKSNFLTLAERETLEPLVMQNMAQVLMVLNSVASVHVARVLNLPISLISREDQQADSSGQGLKEDHRFWLKTSGRAFLSLVAQKLSELSENRLAFSWRSAMLADARESQALVALQDAKILSREEIREYLTD